MPATLAPMPTADILLAQARVERYDGQPLPGADLARLLAERPWALIDRSGRFVRVSAAYAAIFEVAPPALEGRRITVLLPQESHRVALEGHLGFLAGAGDLPLLLTSQLPSGRKQPLLLESLRVSHPELGLCRLALLERVADE